MSNQQAVQNSEVVDIIMSKTLKKPMIYIDESLSEEEQKKEYERSMKLYLILWEKTKIDTDEVINNYQFTQGTRLTYDTIKELLEAEREDGLMYDVNKSLIIVDSPKINISNAISIYKFMSNMKNSLNDDSSFNIDDYVEYDE